MKHQVTQKKQKFRDQNRRDEIDKYFQERRLKMLELLKDMPQGNHEMQQTGQFNTLKNILDSCLVQNQKEMIKIKEQHPLKFYEQYFKHQWKDTQQQKICLLILRYYFIFNDSTPPEDSFLNNLFNIFVDCQASILKNVLFIIYNIIHDFKQTKLKLIKQYNLVDKLKNKLQLYANNSQIKEIILLSINELFKETIIEAEVFKLWKPLTDIFYNYEEQYKINVINALDCIYCLVKANKQMMKEIVINNLISYGLKIYQMVKQRKFIYIILKLIQIYCNQLSNQVINMQILPNLIKMFNKDFAIGSRSAAYSPYKMKLLGCEILFCIICSNIQSFNQCCSNGILEKLYTQFQSSDDPKLLQILIFIFGYVGLRQKNQIHRDELKKSINRALQLVQMRDKYMITQQLVKMERQYNCMNNETDFV